MLVEFSLDQTCPKTTCREPTIADARFKMPLVVRRKEYAGLNVRHLDRVEIVEEEGCVRRIGV